VIRVMLLLLLAARVDLLHRSRSSALLRSRRELRYQASTAPAIAQVTKRAKQLTFLHPKAESRRRIILWAAVLTPTPTFQLTSLPRPSLAFPPPTKSASRARRFKVRLHQTKELPQNHHHKYNHTPTQPQRCVQPESSSSTRL
jgi:hypothetical protein